MALPVASRFDPSTNEPVLKLINEPESKHRFRYDISDTGSHGVISGKNGKKTYPTVQLLNYNGSSSNITIRVTLCTEEGIDHVHQFKQKKSSSELRSSIQKTLDNDFCAVFSDLSIMVKSKGHEILMKRKIENLGVDLSDSDRKEFVKEVKKEYKEILHSVRLKFEAFEKGNLRPVCEPVYSDIISNDKAPCSSKLKIRDMSTDTGSCRGGDDIFILCDTLQKKKPVKITFFEKDEDQNIGEAYASIVPSNIHHQVAIKFKTPPYKANIRKTVAVCLEQEDELSEPKDFTYLPEEAPCNGEPKICHISKTTGCCAGDEDVIILCEKIQGDNVKIKFFEKEGNENAWGKYASFSASDIHHQVAIKFKTPRYEPNIEKTVFVCLEQWGKRSAAVKFNYVPEDCQGKRKRSVPGETMNLISNHMDIASSSCISSGMSCNIFEEQPEQLLASLEEILKNDENRPDSLMMQDTGIPSSALDPESLKNFQLTSLMNFLLTNSEEDPMEQPVHESEEKTDNPAHPILHFRDDIDGVTIDGKLATKIAGINIEDGESSDEVPKKESRGKMFENKRRSFEKYLPFLSNKDSDGNSLLHLAVLYNKSIKKVLYVNKILESNIINAKNNNEQTALHIAVENNSGGVVELLASFADPNIKNADGNNCYHIACQNDFGESLMYLCNESRCTAGGLNDYNNEGLTPLHIALKNYSPACLDFLLTKCRHLLDFSLVESNLGKSFLHYAVEYSPTYVLPLLKEEEIGLNAEDYEGRTPLLIARVKGNYNVVSQLQSAGATPEKGISMGRFCNMRDCRMPRAPRLGPRTCWQSDPTKQASFREKEASERRPCLDGSSKDEESDMIFEEITKNLSVLFDRDMKWKKLAAYVIDEPYLTSLGNFSKSPTRTILKYMKRGYGAQYISKLMSVLDWTGNSEAIYVLRKSVDPQL